MSPPFICFAHLVVVVGGRVERCGRAGEGLDCEGGGETDETGETVVLPT